MMRGKRRPPTIVNKRIGRISGTNSKCKLVKLLMHHVNQTKSTPLNVKYYNHKTVDDLEKGDVASTQTGKRKGGFNIGVAQGGTRRCLEVDINEQQDHLLLLKQTTDDLVKTRESESAPPHVETHEELLVRYEQLNAKYKQQDVIISHLQEAIETLKTNFSVLNDKHTLYISAVLNHARNYARTDPYIDHNRKPNTNSMVPLS